MRAILFVLLLSGGCATQRQPPAAVFDEVAPDPYRVCWTAADADDCVVRVEQELIAARGGEVQRLGDRLLIRTAGGGVVPLEDIPPEGDRALRYLYHGFVEPLRSHLVAVGFWEGGAFVLVSSETGNQTHIQAPPVVSPDGRRFATTSLDLEAGYNPNGIQIWNVTEAGPRLEWGIEGGDTWGASELVWLDAERVEFTRHVLEPPRWEPVAIRMLLHLGQDGLELRPRG